MTATIAALLAWLAGPPLALRRGEVSRLWRSQLYLFALPADKLARNLAGLAQRVGLTVPQQKVGGRRAAVPVCCSRGSGVPACAASLRAVPPLCVGFSGAAREPACAALTRHSHRHHRLCRVPSHPYHPTSSPTATVAIVHRQLSSRHCRCASCRGHRIPPKGKVACPLAHRTRPAGLPAARRPAADSHQLSGADEQGGCRHLCCTRLAALPRHTAGPGRQRQCAKRRRQQRARRVRRQRAGRQRRRAEQQGQRQRGAGGAG